jgi:hypothetical protein
MIDSGQDMGYYPDQNGPSLGLMIMSKEIGAYGPDFANFKLTVQTIINRNTDPINGLYYGSFVDWDVSAEDAQYGDVVKGIAYQYGSGAAYGQIGLPSRGSYWPDGTPTNPMYGAKMLHSADSYWDDLQFAELYDWATVPGIVYDVPVDLSAADKAYEVAFGVTNLGDHGEHTFGFATFGIASGFTGPTQVDNLRKFANKFAGFSRGDVNNDGIINLQDIVRLQRWVAMLPGAKGPIPFIHLGNVNNTPDGTVDAADVAYLAAYFFTGGAPPQSKFMF